MSEREQPPQEQRLISYDAVAERAVRYTRLPLALLAHCALCGMETESMSLHRMDPPPQHKADCPLRSDT